MVNIADLVDPADKEGRTYRDVNLAMAHKYDLGQLVEMRNGVRLFVTRHYRDCDGTPLYSLGFDGDTVARGYTDENLNPVDHPED